MAGGERWRMDDGWAFIESGSGAEGLLESSTVGNADVVSFD